MRTRTAAAVLASVLLCTLFCTPGLAQEPDNDKPIKAPAQIKTVDSNNDELLCDQDYQADFSQDGTNENIVRYRCRTESEKLSEDQHAQRGNRELRDLKRELLEQSGQVEQQTDLALPAAVAEEIAERATAQDNEGAAETPTSIEELEKMAEQPIEVPAFSQAGGIRLPFKTYLSLRVNASNTTDNTELTDGGTRFGAFAIKKFANEQELTGHVEVGVNLFDSYSYLVTPDASGTTDDTFHTRLAYLSYGTDELHLDIGKNWSIYNDVAGMSDRFIALGGVATGIYNANTDGGAAGTGRGDKVIQLRSSTGNWQWGLQLQGPNQIPNLKENLDYNYGYGGSLYWKTIEGFSIGAAYNRSVVDEISSEMRQRGQTGDGEAAVIGLQWEIPRWFFAATAHLSENHEADAANQYYDARGYEVYGSYIFNQKWMVRVGYNDLKPDNSDYRGEAHSKDTILSLQYLLKSKLMDDLLYLEYKLDHGTRFDGANGKDLLLIGIRYNLTY